MSAPDVERLRDVLTEARFRMGCACFPEDGEWCHKCKSARSDINEVLAALSSHPDPLPASADIAGRLITGALWASKWINDGCRESAYHEDEFLKLEAAVEAYRANPSGWIPVGERLPEVECDENCTICSGEYCNTHAASPCDCDCVARHQNPPPPQEGHSGRIYTDPEEIEAAQRKMREGKV